MYDLGIIMDALAADLGETDPGTPHPSLAAEFRADTKRLRMQVLALIGAMHDYAAAQDDQDA
jgi:hypothetical protein